MNLKEIANLIGSKFFDGLRFLKNDDILYATRRSPTDKDLATFKVRSFSRQIFGNIVIVAINTETGISKDSKSTLEEITEAVKFM